MRSRQGLSEEEVAVHDSHYRTGWDLARRYFLLANKPKTILTWFGRRRLRKASGHLESAVRLNPGGWQSMWALGKIHQRLGDSELALDWFKRAHKINPGETDVAREAGLAALDSGDARQAEVFLRAAIRSKPEDPGLVANLALAQLLCGELDDACQSAATAVAADPTDKISASVLRLSKGIREGKLAVPRSMAELRRVAK
jgi:Flp pilus assembly protein TadD